MSKSAHSLSGQSRGKRALSVVFAVISVVYLMPIFLVLMNAFKSNSAVNMDTFAFPIPRPSWAGRTSSRA